MTKDSISNVQKNNAPVDDLRWKKDTPHPGENKIYSPARCCGQLI